nr:histone-lysine N-methyltransferase SETD1A-like [Ipomoea batatas]
MSGSDSQNISGRDYDEGEEVGNDSYTPSTGGSTFDQIDEVELVYADSDEHEGSLRTPTPAGEASTSGQGKSPRVVITALFPHLIPHNVEDVASSLPLGGAPPTSRISRQTLAAPGEANMVLDKAFVTAPAAPRPPRAKVALGAKKAAAAKPSSDPPSRQGKEKRQEPEVEDVHTLKRTRRSLSSRSSELQEGLRERDTLAAALVDQIRDKVPCMKTIMEWSCDCLGEQIAGDILRLTHTTTDLFCRARALEGIREKEIRPLQKQVSSAVVKIKKLKKELAAAEGRAKKAEKAEKEAMEKMKDASSLAQFICTDEAIAKEFLTTFVNTEWAFTSGCRAMQEQVQTALTEGLEETDLPEVLALLPNEVVDPSPKPYSDQAPPK